MPKLENKNYFKNKIQKNSIYFNDKSVNSQKCPDINHLNFKNG